MHQITIISDLLYNECQGGAESSDIVLRDILTEETSCAIGYKKSREVTVDWLSATIKSKYVEKRYFIISNFINLALECQDYLTKHCDYIIIEHDYKCFVERHPTRYKENNYFVPKDQLRNIEFYKNAKCIIYQTDIQKDIIEKNLEINNGFSINGNLFSDEDLLNITINRNGSIQDDPNMSDRFNNDLYCIINDNNPIKGMNDAVKYAKKNNLKYGGLQTKNRELFLESLSRFKGIILMPTILESCSRLAIEAKLMGLEVISRNCPIMNIDFTYESIANCRKLIVDKIKEVLNVQ